MGVAQTPLLPQLLVAGFVNRLHLASAHVHPPTLTTGSHTEEDGKQANNIRVNAASWGPVPPITETRYGKSTCDKWVASGETFPSQLAVGSVDKYQPKYLH